MERSYADDTNCLRTMQAALVLLAISARYPDSFFSASGDPAGGELHAGMRRMTGNDLTVRLPE
jgi:two-component system nitrate/nitrite sensor histidine kinase NarX